ncbi:hypothetical protein AB0K12_32635 [Nonomuraea sp. NPDC049419]|uniref:hypothetical protein n=1 Tax=Nonomuraea sp. NPDC049419 TaxID=3155772 RepID=UPI00342F2DFE
MIWWEEGFCTRLAEAGRQVVRHDHRDRRDGSPPLLPTAPSRPDERVFLRTLEQLAPIRQLWLRRIYDQVKDHPYVLVAQGLELTGGGSASRPSRKGPLTVTATAWPARPPSR